MGTVIGITFIIAQEKKRIYWYESLQAVPARPSIKRMREIKWDISKWRKDYNRKLTVGLCSRARNLSFWTKLCVRSSELWGIFLIIATSVDFGWIIEIIFDERRKRNIYTKWVWLPTGHLFRDQGKFNKILQSIRFQPSRELDPSRLLIYIRRLVMFGRRVFAIYCENHTK